MLHLQITRFAIIGLLATCMHTGVLILLVESAAVAATIANVIAFLFAFVVSYMGHYYWTYKMQSDHSATLLKFFIIALGGLSLNYLIFFIAVDTLNTHYLLALLLVLIIVPALTYVAQKFWAIKSARSLPEK